MNERVKGLIERSEKIFPNGTQTMSKSFKQWVHGDFDFPGFAESGHGCIMKCANGKDYINFMGNLGAGILDYDDKDIKKALKIQLDKGLIFSLPSINELELGELIKSIIPNAEMMRFCKNGSDACTASIRIARSYKKKDYILMAKNGYHGWSDQFCAVSARDYGMPKEFKKFVDFCDYNDLNGLEEKLKTEKYAAFILEPVSLDTPYKNYLKDVRDLCDKYGTILIFDEMITGWRYALGGIQELYSVYADIVCYGKAMSNGTSIACVVGKKEYMKELENVFFSATYFGNSFDVAGSIATITKLKSLKDKIYPHIWKQGKRFKDCFNSTCESLDINAHTIGMEPRMNLKFEYENANILRDLFNQEMIKRGIFIGIQIYPTWAIKSRHMDKILKATEESLEIVSDALKNGNVEKYLEGNPSIQIFKRQ